MRSLAAFVLHAHGHVAHTRGRVVLDLLQLLQRDSVAGAAERNGNQVEIVLFARRAQVQAQCRQHLKAQVHDVFDQNAVVVRTQRQNWLRDGRAHHLLQRAVQAHCTAGSIVKYHMACSCPNMTKNHHLARTQ